MTNVTPARPADDPIAASAPIDLRRRGDAHLQVSRLAADLFWRDGFAATRGEDIAAAAGISARTLWRYFRAKESCAEPILRSLTERFALLLEAWPAELTIREHLSRGASGPVTYSADEIRAMHLVQLGRTEPALRAVWLMVCDEAEARAAAVVARRMGAAPDDADVLTVTAAIGGASRAYNDALAVDYIEHGTSPLAEDVLDVLVWTISDLSGGRIGGASRA